ncbi:MAG: phosphatidylglycerophosphatase A [Rickettsiales bacterium]|nr:phosphatidylglycerophosphatase A [Rickettsiales bacterium]
MHKLHEFFLTFFYSGKAKKAPGTFGSLAALIFWFCLTKWFFVAEISLISQNIFWTIFLILAFIYGCAAITTYTKKFDRIDHQTIVLDEVVGQILPLQITFLLLHENYFSQINIIAIQLTFCFVAFRFFDIKKPSFIGYADRHFKSGFGVMFDDLLCGIIVAFLGFLFFKLTLMIG